MSHECESRAKVVFTDIETGGLPEPNIPEINGTHNVVITGVGGTGVVTIGAVMANPTAPARIPGASLRVLIPNSSGW